jgi:transposase
MQSPETGLCLISLFYKGSAALCRSYRKGVARMIDALSPAKAMLGDLGDDADWCRAALAGIAACISAKVNRKVPIPHDTLLYRPRHRIENMFGKLKDWRRIHTSRSAICISATVILWLNQ